jgi:hypothetical protein
LKAHKRECVDTLFEAVHGQHYSIPYGMDPNESKKISIGLKISCGLRVRMHQGCQWTQTLRKPTILELEYLRLDDKTIDGRIV